MYVYSRRYFTGHSDALGGILAVPTEEEKQALVDQRAILGSQPGSLEAWLLIRSCRTLGIRVAQQCSTAQKLVRFVFHFKYVLSWGDMIPVYLLACRLIGWRSTQQSLT